MITEMPQLPGSCTGLESAHQRGRSSVGRALASQARCRGFESRRPLRRITRMRRVPLALQPWAEHGRIARIHVLRRVSRDLLGAGRGRLGRRGRLQQAPVTRRLEACGPGRPRRRNDRRRARRRCAPPEALDWASVHGWPVPCARPGDPARLDRLRALGAPDARGHVVVDRRVRGTSTVCTPAALTRSRDIRSTRAS